MRNLTATEIEEAKVKIKCDLAKNFAEEVQPIFEKNSWVWGGWARGTAWAPAKVPSILDIQDTICSLASDLYSGFPFCSISSGRLEIRVSVCTYNPDKVIISLSVVPVRHEKLMGALDLS